MAPRNPGGKTKERRKAEGKLKELVRTILDETADKAEFRDKEGNILYDGKTRLEAILSSLCKHAVVNGDTRAARILLEYGYGPPPQTTKVEADGPLLIQVVTKK